MHTVEAMDDKLASTIPRADDPLDGMLCFAVYATGLAFNRVYRPLLDALGLTYPQFLALLLLGHAGEMTVGEIGRRLSLESNTLTPLIKRLEAAGCVERRRDKADERVVRVTLTDKGRRIAADAACLPDRIAAESELRAGETEAVLSGLATLRERLGRKAAASE